MGTSTLGVFGVRKFTCHNNVFSPKNKPFCEDSFSYLYDIYLNLEADIPPEELNLIEGVHASSAKYGDTLSYYIRMVINHCKISEKDVFLDFGSGLGKPVLQVAMETTCKESRGIELSPTRYKRSLEVLEKMKQRGLDTKVTFIQDTFFNIEHWKDVTVAFSWAVCFKHLLPKIAELTTKCDSLKYIALHDCSFEEENVNIEAYNLKRTLTFRKEHQKIPYANDLYIYQKIRPKM